MKRKGPGRDENGLTPEDRRIWSRITGTVAAPRSRKAARVTPGAEAPAHVVVAPPEHPRRLPKVSPQRNLPTAPPVDSRPPASRAAASRVRSAPED
ncbi:MAG: DNA mismatch repair protein MutS, partial [Phenylobacterium sp.]|nr:DNA mismatch repair protein MutS [Phenylobacterium sp.]